MITSYLMKHFDWLDTELINFVERLQVVEVVGGLGEGVSSAKGNILILRTFAFNVNFYTL